MKPGTGLDDVQHAVSRASRTHVRACFDPGSMGLHLRYSLWVDSVLIDRATMIALARSCHLSGQPPLARRHTKPIRPDAGLAESGLSFLPHSQRQRLKCSFSPFTATKEHGVLPSRGAAFFGLARSAHYALVHLATAHAAGTVHFQRCCCCPR